MKEKKTFSLNHYVVKSYKGLMVFLILVAIAALVLAIVYYPRHLPLWEFNPGDGVRVLLGLFVIALFIERAVEVIMIIFRDGDEKMLKAEVDRTNEKYEKEVDNQKKAVLYDDKVEAHRKYNNYRTITKMLALYLTFAIGIIISVAGLRALHPLVDTTVFRGLKDVQKMLFLTMDIIITGALLGGGSKAIHEMVEAVLNTVELYRGIVKKEKKKQENSQ